MGLCTWFAIRAKREVIKRLHLYNVYIYILYTYILASCQNYAHPLSPQKKQPTTSFFCLAGPCQKMFGHDGWMFGKLLTWWMNVIPKGPGMSFATFEVQRFRHGGLRLGLASEEFPEREKGRKGWNFGVFSSFAGETCWEGHFEKLWGGFPCGVNPEVADHTRWRTGNCVFWPKPAGLEQFSNQKRSTGEPKTRRRPSADQCGALASPDKKHFVAFQVGFENRFLGTKEWTKWKHKFYRSTFQRIWVKVEVLWISFHQSESLD